MGLEVCGELTAIETELRYIYIVLSTVYDLFLIATDSPNVQQFPPRVPYSRVGTS